MLKVMISSFTSLATYNRSVVKTRELEPVMEQHVAFIAIALPPWALNTCSNLSWAGYRLRLGGDGVGGGANVCDCGLELGGTMLAIA